MQNPEVYQHFSWMDEGHRTGPEELYAEMGAWLGPNIFNTPLGKYYEGIIEQPQRIPLKKVRRRK